MRTSSCTQAQAWEIYERLRIEANAGLLPEPTGFDATFRAISNQPEISPKRWADDYLLAFAETAELRLVTFDRALAARTPNAVLLTA